jgi:hypothetical protein
MIRKRSGNIEERLFVIFYTRDPLDTQNLILGDLIKLNIVPNRFYTVYWICLYLYHLLFICKHLLCRCN